MNRKLFFILCLILLPAVAAMARENGSEPKELSGMSIVGNDEAPKSLYIVPWKSSELGVETSLKLTLDDGADPVDRDVFRRQLDFHEVSTANPSAQPRVVEPRIGLANR
jgi:hypothetical protein